jgi:hypothetical protein
MKAADLDQEGYFVHILKQPVPEYEVFLFLIR